MEKAKTISFPIVERDISKALSKQIPKGIVPDDVLLKTDIICHICGESPFTVFYKLKNNQGDFLEVECLGELLHLGFSCDDFRFETWREGKSSVLLGCFINNKLGFIDRRHFSTEYPKGVVFTPLSMSQIHIRGNQIPLNIKEKVELINSKIMNEFKRLQLVQEKKGFKYGWIKYKLDEFIFNLHSEIEKIFENDVYFYLPENPVFGDPHSCLPVIGAIKYIQV